LPTSQISLRAVPGGIQIKDLASLDPDVLAAIAEIVQIDTEAGRNSEALAGLEGRI
jgi:hypothetical protein